MEYTYLRVSSLLEVHHLSVPHFFFHFLEARMMECCKQFQTRVNSTMYTQGGGEITSILPGLWQWLQDVSSHSPPLQRGLLSHLSLLISPQLSLSYMLTAPNTPQVPTAIHQIQMLFTDWLPRSITLGQKQNADTQKVKDPWVSL